jgi:hypothetical protein
VVRPFWSTIFVGDPQAGASVVVVGQPSGLVTVLPVTGPPVAGV